MYRHSKIILATTVATGVLGAIVGTTSANRFAISSQTFRATWASLKLIGFATATCKLTIEGSFHSRTSSKIAVNLTGYITRSIVNECIGGTGGALTALLPWHIRYSSFSGTLPTITTITLNIIDSHFVVTAIGVECLFASTAASPIREIVSRNTATGVATSIRIDETSAIPVSSGALCGTSGRLEGTSAQLTVAGGTAAITVTLVQ